MGGRSKRKSSSNNTVNTGALTSQGAAQQGNMLKGAEQVYGNLQTAMIGKMFPAFGELVKGGMQSFGQHPLANFMGAALGMPIQMEAPGFIDEFINKYTPQEPVTPVEQAPQPYNVNDDMRMRMGIAGPYGRYNINRPGLFGGVRR